MHVIYDLILNKAGLVSIIFLFIIIDAPYLHPYYRQIIHCKLTPIIRSNLKIKPTILVQMTQEKNIYSRVLWGGPVCFPPGTVCCDSSLLTPKVHLSPASHNQASVQYLISDLTYAQASTH